jgi:hypothetical protein
MMFAHNTSESENTVRDPPQEVRAGYVRVTITLSRRHLSIVDRMARQLVIGRSDLVRRMIDDRVPT